MDDKDLLNTLVVALKNLEKASSDVSRYGAQTGPQWGKMTIAILKARSVIDKLNLLTKE